MTSKKVKYKNLTEEQKQFYDQKTFSNTIKIKGWLSLMSKLVIMDEARDKKEKSTKTMMTTCIVIAVVSLFIGFIFPPLLVLTFVLAILAITFRSKISSLKKKDFSNYMREFFFPVLRALEMKTSSEAKLSATVDFTSLSNMNGENKGKQPNGRNLILYTPKYIAAKIKLKDQALLEFAVADEIKVFNWSKRSASGKIKSKIKTKITHHGLIKIIMPKSEYRLKDTPNAIVDIVEQDNQYIAKFKIKIKKEGIDHVLAPKVFFDGLSTIYSLFEPLNPVEQPSPNDSKGKERLKGSGTDDEDYVEDDLYYMHTPYIWHGAYFDNYDHDGFDYGATGGSYDADDDGATVFDS